MKKGFTLVEMLVALFIFALLASAGVTMMRFTVDNQSMVRERTDRLAQFQTARGLMKADLSQAADRRVRDADGRVLNGAFVGGEGDVLLRFTRRGWENPDGEARASIQSVEYRIEDDRLMRYARVAADGGAFGEPQLLLDGVSDTQITYLDRGQWVPNLPGGPSDPLPQAVRIGLTVEGVGRVEQTLMVSGARS